LRTDPGRSHPAINAIDTALLAQLTQIVADLAVAVHAADLQPRLLDGNQQTLVFLDSAAPQVQESAIGLPLPLNASSDIGRECS